MFHSALGHIGSVLSLAFLVSACASGYSKFYKSTPLATPERIASLRAAPPTGSLIVEHASPVGLDAQALWDAYFKRGYTPIGSSFFNSARPETEVDAVETGAAIGADLVLILNPRSTGSTPSTMALTTPGSSPPYSSGTATAHALKGPATVHGNGTTTTYGSMVTHVPVIEHRNDYGAVYFIQRKWVLGVLWRNLDDAERLALQSGKGVCARVIVDDSPAHGADILPGDILVAIDGEAVANEASASELLRQRAGQVAQLTLYRQGAAMDKSVQLSAA